MWLSLKRRTRGREQKKNKKQLLHIHRCLLAVDGTIANIKQRNKVILSLYAGECIWLYIHDAKSKIYPSIRN